MQILRGMPTLRIQTGKGFKIREILFEVPQKCRLKELDGKLREIWNSMQIFSKIVDLKDSKKKCK